jgi:hypothetical protein
MAQAWREAYDQIRHEMSDEELRQLITRVEAAVFERLRELSNTDNSAAEHYEIAETMKKIREMQIEKLKYPEFGVHGDVWKFGIPQT